MRRITLEHVLEKLETLGCRPVRREQGWDALCPAHPDSEPSLHLDRGRTRPFILFCHAGCSFQEILEALELWR